MNKLPLSKLIQVFDLSYNDVFVLALKVFGILLTLCILIWILATIVDRSWIIKNLLPKMYSGKILILDNEKKVLSEERDKLIKENRSLTDRLNIVQKALEGIPNNIAKEEGCE